MKKKNSCLYHKEPYTLIDTANKMLLCNKCQIKQVNQGQVIKIVEFFQKAHIQNNQDQKICRNVLTQCLLQQLKHFEIINISLDAIKELDKVKLKSKETNLKTIQLFDLQELTTQNIQKFFIGAKIVGLQKNLEDVQIIYDQKISYEIENMNVFSQSKHFNKLVLLQSMNNELPQVDKVDRLKQNIQQNRCSNQLTQIFSDFHKRIYGYEIQLMSPQIKQSTQDTILFQQAAKLQFQIYEYQEALLKELQEQHQLLNDSSITSEHIDPIPFSEDKTVPDPDILSMSQIIVEKEIEDLQEEKDPQESKQEAYKLAKECEQNFLEGNYINGVLKIQEAIELNNENSQYYYLKCMCYIKQEKFSEATEAIEKALDLKKDAQYYYIKAKILSYQGFKKSALPYLQTCQKKNDQIEGCYLLKAQIYEQFGEKMKALTNYEQVLRINRYNQLAHLGIQNLS